jgi:acetylornithine deacetylase/succinyl-diaminopimelate desuccinylase-like protein
MNREAIYRYIDAHQDEHLEKVRAFLRQPSISAEGRGIRETAAMLLGYFRDLGCQEAELVETDGHPGVWAYYDAGAPTTIVSYLMYDVQPVADQRWTHDPFAADIVADPPFPRVVIARGAGNSKGPLRMWLNSLEAILAVEGRLPVNVMFLAEGEEELGSPHFPQLVARYRDPLATADAVLTLGMLPGQNRNGDARLSLGNKGIVDVELHCSGKSWGRGPQTRFSHSGRKSVMDSPVWRLIHALGTLTGPDGNAITVDGLLDDVVPPSADDEDLIARLAEQIDEAALREWMDVARFADDLTGSALLRQLFFAPSLNVNGLWAGYTGPGRMSVTPHEATCRIDVRLVPNMRSADVVAKIRAHLERRGYGDIAIRVPASYEFSRTDPRAAVVRAVRQVYEARGVPYEIWPMIPGSAPMYLFTDEPLNLPLVFAGLGHGGRFHAHDEYLVIEGDGRVAGLVEVEQANVDILGAYAQLAASSA